MRVLSIHLLAATMLLAIASTASAYRVDMTSNTTGPLDVNDTVTITVTFDTEGAADVMLLGVGVLFDKTSFDYVPGSSSTPTYLLYTTAKNAYLAPASTCDPVCKLSTIPGVTDQLQLDFLSSQIAQNKSVPGISAPGGESLGSYVFRVKSIAAGTANFNFIFSDARGSILQLGNTTQPPLGLGAAITVNLPEPTSAALSLAALLTVAAVRVRRQRMR